MIGAELSIQKDGEEHVSVPKFEPADTLTAVFYASNRYHWHA
ncbi:hypothetical protein QWZ16_21840 [Vibrio ostreicida]|uniref:Uncharacterized protein n=1 Tax=Vibrio ostreicida TaxID=526588 RepID=A0ABT8BYK1_9VIBR|nr:hypothetical protein [Vibrio ostreicida]MDN3612240.1 hypothetical protein [Vibrio ostreicida]